MTGRALPGMPLSADDLFICSIPDGGTPPTVAVVPDPPAPVRMGVWLVLAACGRCTRAAYCRRHYPLTGAETAARGR